jgi:hypothetical protein
LIQFAISRLKGPKKEVPIMHTYIELQFGVLYRQENYQHWRLIQANMLPNLAAFALLAWQAVIKLIPSRTPEP